MEQNIINALTHAELEAFDSYRNHYAYNTDYEIYGDYAPATDILKVWANAKSEFLWKLFGEKLILSKPFDFELGAYYAEEEIDNLLSGAEHRTFLDSWEDLQKKLFPPERVLDEYATKVNGGVAVYWDRNTEDYYRMSNLLYASQDVIFNNTIDYKISLSVPTPDGKVITIRKGDKWIRAIGKIAKAYNLPGFDEFRIKHSMLKQTSAIKGYLNLSIHPLDYVTMSDNNSSWNSCMSWMDSGCYRRGTVEMMNSPCVIVAYLTSTLEKKPLGCINWNDKKWRQLIIVNNDCITTVRPYPYSNDALDIEVMDWIKELYAANINSEVKWSKNYGYNPRHGYAYDKDEEKPVTDDTLVANKTFDFYTHAMYNDFCHTNHKISVSSINAEVHNTITYSGESQCMWCGTTGTHTYFGCEEDLVCEDCVDKAEPTYCNYCDEAFDPEERGYMTDAGYHYCCTECYKKDTFPLSSDPNIRESRHSLEKIFIWDDENNTFVNSSNDSGKFDMFTVTWREHDCDINPVVVPTYFAAGNCYYINKSDREKIEELGFTAHSIRASRIIGGHRNAAWYINEMIIRQTTNSAF